MLIGYVRVSKSDGSQTLAPQRDAMLAAGVNPTRIYEDLASGRLAAARARGRMGGRPRKMDRATLMMAMADRNSVAAKVAKRLNLTTTTLYTYVNGDGTPKAAGQAVLDGTHRPGTAGKIRSRPPPSLRRHSNTAAGA